MKFFLLIKVKMPTIVGILTSMSRKNSILCLSVPKNAEILDILILTSIKNVMLRRVEHDLFYNFGTISPKEDQKKNNPGKTEV